MYADLSHIAPEHYTKHITARLTDIKAVESPDDRGIFIQVLESAYRFSLGAFAGGEYCAPTRPSVHRTELTGAFAFRCRCVVQPSAPRPSTPSIW